MVWLEATPELLDKTANVAAGTILIEKFIPVQTSICIGNLMMK